jgi:hypothetical protein
MLPNVEQNDLRISFDKPSSTVDLVTFLTGAIDCLKNNNK